jgi:hypothetical protein
MAWMPFTNTVPMQQSSIFPEIRPHGSRAHVENGRFSVYNAGCQAFESDRPANKTTDAEWEDWYWTEFTQSIRDFAKAHPSMTYIEGPLDDVETTSKVLEDKVGIPSTCSGRHYISKTKNEKEGDDGSEYVGKRSSWHLQI